MTAVSLLFLLLLAMASFLFYRAAESITRRFFRLPRAAFHAVCISCTAVFFAAACTGGLLSLHALRGAEYARGYTDARDAASAEQAAGTEQQRAASETLWQEAYGEGFAAGFAAARAEAGIDDARTEIPPFLDGQGDAAAEQDGSSSEGALPPDHTPEGTPYGGKTGDGKDVSLPVKDDSLQSAERNAEAPEDTGDGSIPAGTAVYYTAGGSVLHRDRNCSYLKKAKEVLTCDASEAPDLPPCSRCG